MREEFSLFSLGIGFDVDYDFLERIAMENRGVAQRIYTSHDASDQIRVRQTSVPKTPIHPSLPNPAYSCITTPPPSLPSVHPPLYDYLSSEFSSYYCVNTLSSLPLSPPSLTSLLHSPLQRFYSQVSSPLLRKITVQFPEDSVSDVTQNHFDKYFSGSELVVAGKVLPSESTTLNSFTTAFAVSHTYTCTHAHSYTQWWKMYPKVILALS